MIIDESIANRQMATMEEYLDERCQCVKRLRKRPWEICFN